MNKRIIGYWLTTGLLSLALFGSAFGKLTQQEPMVQSMEHLGHPLYLLTLLGIWYGAGAIALLMPGTARIKEWAYAGITFAFTGALASHIAAGDPIAQSAPVFVLLALTGLSYWLRPADRRLTTASDNETKLAATATA